MHKSKNFLKNLSETEINLSETETEINLSETEINKTNSPINFTHSPINKTNSQTGNSIYTIYKNGIFKYDKRASFYQNNKIYKIHKINSKSEIKLEISDSLKNLLQKYKCEKLEYAPHYVYRNNKIELEYAFLIENDQIKNDQKMQILNPNILIEGNLKNIIYFNTSFIYCNNTSDNTVDNNTDNNTYDRNNSYLISVKDQNIIEYNKEGSILYKSDFIIYKNVCKITNISQINSIEIDSKLFLIVLTDIKTNDDCTNINYNDCTNINYKDYKSQIFIIYDQIIISKKFQISGFLFMENLTIKNLSENVSFRNLFLYFNIFHSVKITGLEFELSKLILSGNNISDNNISENNISNNKSTLKNDNVLTNIIINILSNIDQLTLCKTYRQLEEKGRSKIENFINPQTAEEIYLIIGIENKIKEYLDKFVRVCLKENKIEYLYEIEEYIKKMINL